MRRLAQVFFMVVLVAGAAVAAGAPEAVSASYSQVVDNATEGRFKADGGWGASSYGLGVYEENYRFARPSEAPAFAEFKVEIPETANYAVHVRWPKVDGLNDSAPVGVTTTSGTKWTKVNQRENGGRWVRLGVYEMQAGDDYSVRFSRRTSGEGYVIADAVKVERVSSAASSKETSERDSASRPTGKEVVREAKKWSGVRYRLGGASRSGIDCSGLTMMVYKEFGISLPHSDAKQYRHGVKVTRRPEAGDLVFFNEHDKGISHVGIYAGNGRIIHASNHFNKVVESDMKHIKGYVGAKRLLKQQSATGDRR